MAKFFGIGDARERGSNQYQLQIEMKIMAHKLPIQTWEKGAEMDVLHHNGVKSVKTSSKPAPVSSQAVSRNRPEMHVLSWEFRSARLTNAGRASQQI